MSNLTRNQIIVLRHMTGALKPGGQMRVKDFEDVATVSRNRDRWASNPLYGLRDRGMVEMRPAAQGSAGKNGWRITMRGLEALLEAKIRLAGKDTPAARVFHS